MAIHIGKTIRIVLKSKGVSHSALAKKINTTRQNIQSITKGETIDTGILIKICEALEHDFFQYYRLNSEIETVKLSAKKEDIDILYDLLSSALEKISRLKKAN